jgi:serine/threonine protein kinase
MVPASASPSHAAASSSSGVVASSANPTPRYFALKMLKKSEIIRLKQVEHIKAEKAILSRIAHPYIISLYATFQDEQSLFMVSATMTHACGCDSSICAMS